MSFFPTPRPVQWKPTLLYYGLWLGLFAGIPLVAGHDSWSDKIKFAVALSGILFLFLPGVVVLLLAERGRGPAGSSTGTCKKDADADAAWLYRQQPQAQDAPRSQAELSAEAEGMEQRALDVLQLILSFNAKYEQSPALKRTNELLLICIEERRQAVAAQQDSRKLQ